MVGLDMSVLMGMILMFMESYITMAIPTKYGVDNVLLRHKGGLEVERNFMGRATGYRKGLTW